MGSWYFFPIARGLKVPAFGEGWKTLSTNDEAQIQRWLDDGYNLAVDCEKSGIAVVDLDVSKVTGDFVGADTWRKQLLRFGDVGRTYSTKTPRGGRHLYFKLSGPLRTLTGAFDGVDTRGLGGYVLVEPSETADGAYAPDCDVPLLPLPAWLIPAIDAAHPIKEDRPAVEGLKLDLEHNVAAAIADLKRLAPFEQGSGADIKLFKTMADIRDRGVSEEKAVELVECYCTFQPWDENKTPAFIRRKAENAYHYAQNPEVGAWGVGSLADTYRAVLDQLPAVSEGATVAPAKWELLRPEQQDTLKPPAWLIPDVIARRSTAALFAPPHSFKSFVAMEWACTVAGGRGAWGRAEGKPETVIYVTDEGGTGIPTRRRAWEQVRGLPTDFILSRQMPRASSDDDIDAFARAVVEAGLHPGLIVFDTWISFLGGLKENDPTETQRGVAQLRRLRDVLQTSCLVVAHSGTGDDKRVRGTNALIGGVDALHRVERPSLQLTTIAVHNLHHKDAATKAEPWYLQGNDIGGTLVFDPIGEATWKAATTVTSDLDPATIGRALKDLGARGDATVTTHVLASHLRQAPIDEAPQETMIEVDRLVRKLRARSQHLGAYCEKREGELVWFLPE